MGDEIIFSRSDIELFNRLNELRKSEIKSAIDEKDIKRRERQSLLINEIKSRAESGQYSI